MNKQTEALKIALNDMKCLQEGTQVDLNIAIQACKEELEQPAQEPVAWMDENGHVFENESDIDDSGSKIPLYTHPAPSWQGLNDDEMLDIADKSWEGISPHADTMNFARAIEQALKEKNGR